MSKREEKNNQQEEIPKLVVLKPNRSRPKRFEPSGNLSGKSSVEPSGSSSGDSRVEAKKVDVVKLEPLPKTSPKLSSNPSPERKNVQLEPVGTERSTQEKLPKKDREDFASSFSEPQGESLSEDELRESQWGQPRESTSQGGGRVWVMGGVIVLALVAVLLGLRFLSGDGEEKIQKTEVVSGSTLVEKGEKTKTEEENSSEKWFRAHSGELAEQALTVLKGYMAASTKEARSQWVRNPERYLKLVDGWPVPISPLLSENDPQTWNIEHTEKTAYLIFKGRDKNYMPFRAYFTREGDTLKLDWEATTAWSEVSLDALRKAGEKRRSGASASAESDLPRAVYTDSVLLRCLIRKKEQYYAGVYDDERYSAFMLLSSDKMQNVWGYAPRGSELDLKLRKLLSYGYFVESLKRDVCVTVRIRVNQKDALPSQVELVKMEYPEWVTPEP